MAKRSVRRIRPVRLKECWQAFSKFKSKQIAYSTAYDYDKIFSRICLLPKYLESAIEIRDWMLERYSSEVVRRDLMMFNACCRWAVESELLAVNPFEGLTRQIKRKTNSTAWAAFTSEEREVIIKAIQTDFPFYTSWVQFLFWVGCRPEEAAGLKWKHIKADLSQIHFREAAPAHIKQTQETKTHRSRIFPCNARLKALLATLKPEQPAGETLVFQGVEGGRFEYHNFQTRQWKPTVVKLADQGLITEYLPQGHCRHTWITLALQAGMPVKDVAYLVGNSPEIIYKHYASRSRVIEVPEF